MIAIGLGCAAFAQTVPDGDFESGTLTGWTEKSTVEEYIGGGDYTTYDIDAATLQSSPARGAWSLKIQPPYPLSSSPMADPYLVVTLRSAPLVVTREELHYARIDSGLSPRVELVDPDSGLSILASDNPGAASTDAFAERVVDASAACGRTLQARVTVHASVVGQPSGSIDDLAFAGGLCPGFVDGDGDGLCPEGTDLDLDGDCAEPGEPSGGPPVDCDDTSAAIGACLVVESAPTWIRVLEPFTVTVSGAAPGERLALLGGFTEGRTCAPSGSCIDIGAPWLGLDAQTADGDGRATFTVIPRRGRTQPYETAILQAIAPRPGGATLHSGAIRVPVRPQAADPADPGLVNGDFEAGLDSWSHEDGIFGYRYDSLQWSPCPPGAVDPAIGRGTGSLHTELLLLGYFDYSCTGGTYSRPVRLTHEALGWSQLGDGTIDVADLATGARVELARSISRIAEDGFVESVADVSAGCGLDVVVQVTGEDAWWDDLAIEGPICREYRDRDGDGFCPDGVDLDGDGDCASAGEPYPHSPAIEPLRAVIDDFPGPELGDSWEDQWSYPTLVDQGGGDYALFLTPGWYGMYWSPDWITAADAVITFDHLAFSTAKVGTADWRASTLDVDGYFDGSENAVALSTELPPLGPGIWGQTAVDLSAHCGGLLTALGFFQYDGDYLEPDELWPDPVMFDDLGFIGDPCPQYVDSNGDGACAEGLDLDADGLCVADGEPTPGVVQDPLE